MRFTDGLWKRPIGSDFNGAVEVVEVLTETNDELEFIAAPKHIATRGDTLNCGLVTVNISSPADDVIKVVVEHHRGVVAKGPEFELYPDGPPSKPKTSISRPDSDHIKFTTGSTSVTLNTAPHSYGLVFDDANLGEICNVGKKGQAWVDMPRHLAQTSAANTSYMASYHSAIEHTNSESAGQNHSSGGWVRYMLNELSLSVGETIYGLGERFGPLIKNGQNHQIWNSDGGTSSELGYKNIPFYLSSKGYGVFVNHSEEVDVEVGREKSSRVGISVRGEKLEYYLIGGGSMKAALQNYVRLTGMPPVPPAWSYGLYLSSCFTTKYDAKTVSSFLSGMRDRGCPVRVFHFDCFWMKQFDWSSFEWDKEFFPDPKGYLSSIKKEFNIKVCVWINPYISQRARIFKEGVEKGYFIKRSNGDVFQWDEWQAGMACVDFTNPEAYKWYAGLIQGLLDVGVDTIKTDFGERIPYIGVKYHNGADPMKMHNYYAHIYNQCVYDALGERLGKDQAALFARSATAGGQRFPIHWGGDCESTYEAMAETLRGGLSLACSGFSFWSHDIGGFEGTPNEPLFCRWIGFGLFSSHSRLHGSSSYRVPWYYGDEAVKATAKMTKTKMRLMPYIYAQSIHAHETGIPLLRPMVMEFPDDPTCQYLDKQYMFGDSLLVAPVFHDSKAKYYLPAGRWTDIWSEEVVVGPKWVTRDNYPLHLIPVFVKQNTVLLLGPEDVSTPDYDYDQVDLEVRAYEVDESVEVVIPTIKGAVAGKVSVGKDGSVKDKAGFKFVPRVKGLKEDRAVV